MEDSLVHKVESKEKRVEVGIEYNEPIVIESFCVNCHNQGETRMMLTTIPYYKQLLVSSFHCPHCGYKNSELQNTGKFYNNL